MFYLACPVAESRQGGLCVMLLFLIFYDPSQTTHTHPFNGPLSRTNQVSQYQKGKTNLDFTEARDSEWQWHQLDQYASLHLALVR